MLRISGNYVKYQIRTENLFFLVLLKENVHKIDLLKYSLSLMFYERYPKRFTRFRLRNFIRMRKILVLVVIAIDRCCLLSD